MPGWAYILMLAPVGLVLVAATYRPPRDPLNMDKQAKKTMRQMDQTRERFARMKRPVWWDRWKA